MRYVIFLTVILSTCISGKVLCRPTPFQPWSTTQTSSHQIMTRFPFEAYKALGYVSGPSRFIFLFKAPNNTFFYLKKGQYLGREKYKLIRSNRNKHEMRLSFIKKVHDLKGERITLRKYKLVTST